MHKEGQKLRISVSMITLNERENIERALCSCSFADEIVVVDGGSTDGTLDILRKHDKVVLIQNPWNGHFGQQRQISLEHCSGDWVIRLDADEAFSEEFEKGIRELLERTPPEVVGYHIRQCNLVGNEKFYSKGLDYFEVFPRIWRNRQGIRWEGHIHEKPVGIDGETRHWDVYVVHYGFLNKQRYAGKGQFYSTIPDSGYSKPEELLFREYDIQPRPPRSKVSSNVPAFPLPSNNLQPKIAILRGRGFHINEIKAYEPLLEEFAVEVYTKSNSAIPHDHSLIPVVRLPDRSIDPPYQPSDPEYMIGLEFALFDCDLIYLDSMTSIYTLQAIELKKKFSKPIICLQKEVPDVSDHTRAYIKGQAVCWIDFFIVPSSQVARALRHLGIAEEKLTVIPYFKDTRGMPPERISRRLSQIFRNIINASAKNDIAIVYETSHDSSSPQHEQTFSSLVEAFKQDPDNKDVVLRLTKRLKETNRFDEAKGYLESYLTYHPLDLDALAEYADLCLSLKQYPEARETISKLELFGFNEEVLKILLQRLSEAEKNCSSDSSQTVDTACSVKLHIGCGSDYKEGYINIDGYDASVADVVAMAHELPFPDGYADLIESHHLIEHLSFEEFRDTVKEWYRVLKPGGMLVAECPDLIENMKIFLNSDYKKRWLWYRNELPFGRVAAFYGNQFHPGQFHKNGFDRERLSGLLDELGFVRISTRSIEGTPEPNENFIVEAFKPQEDEEGFSLILPTYSAAKELDLCLRSLKKNSRLKHELIILVDRDRESGGFSQSIIEVLTRHRLSFNISFFINDKNYGPYASWNRGAAMASRKVLCFITDDQYFAPDWDINLKRHIEDDRILTSQLVEPGIIGVWKDNIEYNCGVNPDEFDEEAFLQFVANMGRSEIVEGGFFIPLVMFRETFQKIGGFTTDDSFGRFDSSGRHMAYPHDVLFIKRAEEMGIRLYQVKNSFSYHFQGSSWRAKERKGVLRR